VLPGCGSLARAGDRAGRERDGGSAGHRPANGQAAAKLASGHRRLRSALINICSDTLTPTAATTNTDVGPTPYYITIYSETTGALLATCGFGTSCTATVAQALPGSQAFEAFVGDSVPGTGRPGFALVDSNEVTVNWWFIRRR
jgi:hypothetical protein